MYSTEIITAVLAVLCALSYIIGYYTGKARGTKYATSLQYKIDHAKPGDTIYLSPGQYKEPITMRPYINLHFGGTENEKL